MTASYETLPEIAKGYAWTIIETQGCSPDKGGWDNVTEDDFSEEFWKKIIEDCQRFHEAAARLHPKGTVEGLAYDIDDYDLGRGFYLIRQGTGVGFGEFGDLGDLLVGLADKSNFLDIAVNANGKIDFARD